MSASPLYLDHNATAPLHPAARAALLAALDAANPMSPHAAGRAAAMIVDRARQAVGALVERDPRTVVFTSGATEANAWVLRGLPSAERPLVVASAVEHPSVLAWATHTLPVDGEGMVRLEALEALLAQEGPRVAVVSVMAANNETGVIQPLSAVARQVRAAGAVFHCDATQAPGRLPLAAVSAAADLLTLSAHKLGGPKGVGALVGAVEGLAPLLRGGPQERGRRAGTHNVPAIAGMGAAAEVVREVGPMSAAGRDHLEAICRRYGGQILGDRAPRLPNTTAVLFPLPGDLIVMALDLAGIQASTGAACSSGASQESHVLAAMGLQGIPVRLSLGPDSPTDLAARILEDVLSQILAPLHDNLHGGSPAAR